MQEKEVWIIEDEPLFQQQALQLWAAGTTGLVFRGFATAREALKEIRRRKEVKQKLPNLIVVDDFLGSDLGLLRWGPHVVDCLRSNGLDGTRIFAYGRNETYLQRMQENGADLAFIKGHPQELTEYIQRAAHADFVAH